ncbi:MAG: fluoride efflux transporter CrcB [Eubacteriales bacterium]
MKKYIYMGFGGSIGAIFRYLLKQIAVFDVNNAIPVNTFLVNISGCFLLGFILTAAIDSLKVRPNLQLGLTTGFLGAFTTFATICKETVVLISDGNYSFALLYIIASVTFGFTSTYLGFKLADKIFIKKPIKEDLSLICDFESEDN